MATHSSILTWRIPWTEKPGGLTVHSVTQSWTQLKQLSTHTHTFEAVFKICICLAHHPKDLSTGRRRQWHPTPVLLPGKSHGQRSLVGCSPWGRSESGTTERLHFDFSLSCIGEGNGNPFQCSCLENPRNRGPWWAAMCGVAQSRTRLK